MEAKLSFVEPGRRWTRSLSPSKAPGICYQGLFWISCRKDVKNLRRYLTVIWCFFLFPRALPLGAWGFLLSLNHDWFACQLQRAEFLRKGSNEGSLFRMFPLLLQSIISNQMRPRRLRGAWFSRLLRHPARRWSGSILSPEPTIIRFTVFIVSFLSVFRGRC